MRTGQDSVTLRAESAPTIPGNPVKGFPIGLHVIWCSSNIHVLKTSLVFAIRSKEIPCLNMILWLA